MTYAAGGQAERTKAGGTPFSTGPLGLSVATTGGLLSSTSTYTTRDTAGALVSLRTPTGTYYYLTDVRGSVVALTDATWAVANR